MHELGPCAAVGAQGTAPGASKLGSSLVRPLPELSPNPGTVLPENEFSVQPEQLCVSSVMGMAELLHSSSWEVLVKDGSQAS